MKKLRAFARRLQRIPAGLGSNSFRRSKTLLGPALANLEILNRDTEKDFLAVGGKLMEFSAAARRISADMNVLSEMVSGERGHAAAAVLARVLEQLRQTEAHLAEEGRALASISQASQRAVAAFGQFRDTVCICRALGSLTRIETARLGNVGAGFGHLADEVRTLTENIESSGQGVLAASASLDRKMQDAMRRVTALRQGALRDLPALLDQVTAGMQSLAGEDQRAHAASLRQAAGYTQVSAAMEDLVGALQFHDITRQKIEHVAEALRQLEAQPPGAADAGSILTLESAQLSDAGRIFAASVERIEGNLRDIAERVAGMARESERLLEPSSGGRISFFERMESCFTAIAKILSACTHARHDTRCALSALEEDVTRIRSSAADVSEIGIRLRRLAINATIRASRIGAAGNALDVLAGVMQRVADDSAAMSCRISAQLEAIIETARCLSQAPGADSARGTAGQILSELERTVLDMRESSRSSAGQLQQIVALSSELCAGIGLLRSGFTAGTTLAESIQQACAALGEVAADRSRRRAPPGASLAHLARNYTMQSERAVHQAVTDAAEPPAAAPVAPQNSDDLGDNVELF